LETEILIFLENIMSNGCWTETRWSFQVSM
jgi:hypothetical protein